MKRKTSATPAALVVFCVLSTQGQGTFQNLDFEAAHDVPGPISTLVPSSNAIPFWSAYSNGTQLSEIPYNVFTCGPPVQLVGAEIGDVVIAGQFSVEMFGGMISQTAVIPADAESLVFKTLQSQRYMLQLMLDDQELQPILLSTGANYSTYGADISRFAGQSATLSFSMRGLLDDIQFSTQPVPEPSAGVLFLVGLSMCGLLGWCKRKPNPA